MGRGLETAFRRLAATAAAAAVAGAAATAAAEGGYAFRGFSTTLVRGEAQFAEMTEVCRHDFGPDARLCAADEWSAAAGDEMPQAASWIGPAGGSGTGGGATGYYQCGRFPLRGLGLALMWNGHLVGISCARFRPVTCCTPQR